jgi:hypothetical protein
MPRRVCCFPRPLLQRVSPAKSPKPLYATFRCHRSYAATYRSKNDTAMNILCIDVGSFKNIGWANQLNEVGDGKTLESELQRLGLLLKAGHRLALGFEAPIWTPRRADLTRLTQSRGGVERKLCRAWSAGAGCGALSACLALMPWCLKTLHDVTGPLRATTDVVQFAAGHGQLLVWEAFVSGAAKAPLHHEDAALAVAAFVSRFPDIESDVPPEDAVNHAATALYIAGFEIETREFGQPGLVVCAFSAARQL